MEISKNILGFVFFVLSCSDVLAASTMPKSTLIKHLNVLNRSMGDLQTMSTNAWNTMDLVRNKTWGYPNRFDKKCLLPISALYNASAYKFFNAVTRKQHLTKIKNTLQPLYEATRPTYKFHRKEKDATFKKALEYVAHSLRSMVRKLSRMGYKGQGSIVYSSTKLTNQVKSYIICHGKTATVDAVTFIRYVTFVESLELAMMDLAEDWLYIRKELRALDPKF